MQYSLFYHHLFLRLMVGAYARQRTVKPADRSRAREHLNRNNRSRIMSIPGITLSTPAGLCAGDSFRFVFVTDAFIFALSPNIGDYNQFVNTQAGGATYNGSIVSWVAIGSTPSVNAIDNVGVTATPVYLADGTLVAPDTTSSGLWSGSLVNSISSDLAGNKRNVATWSGTNPSGFASSHGGPGRYGTRRKWVPLIDRRALDWPGPRRCT